MCAHIHACSLRLLQEYSYEDYNHAHACSFHLLVIGLRIFCSHIACGGHQQRHNPAHMHILSCRRFNYSILCYSLYILYSHTGTTIGSIQSSDLHSLGYYTRIGYSYLDIIYIATSLQCHKGIAVYTCMQLHSILFHPHASIQPCL